MDYLIRESRTQPSDRPRLALRRRAQTTVS